MQRPDPERIQRRGIHVHIEGDGPQTTLMVHSLANTFCL